MAILLEAFAYLVGAAFAAGLAVVAVLFAVGMFDRLT